MNLNTCNFIKRIEQVLAELDISAIEEYVIIIIIIIIVIYDVITVDYCKCILLYSPLNSYLYVHWILDFK